MILPKRPFLGCPVVSDLTQLDADIVLLGIRMASRTSSTTSSGVWPRLPRQFERLELEEARAAGHRLITAADVHERGQRWLCDQLPSGGEVLVSIDCDGLDVVELLPPRDVNGLTALTATRFLMLPADTRARTAHDTN